MQSIFLGRTDFERFKTYVSWFSRADSVFNNVHALFVKFLKAPHFSKASFGFFPLEGDSRFRLKETNKKLKRHKKDKDNQTFVTKLLSEF